MRYANPIDGASSELMPFSYSDRVAQEKLGFFREQRG